MKNSNKPEQAAMNTAISFLQGNLREMDESAFKRMYKHCSVCSIAFTHHILYTPGYFCGVRNIYELSDVWCLMFSFRSWHYLWGHNFYTNTMEAIWHCPRHTGRRAQEDWRLSFLWCSITLWSAEVLDWKYFWNMEKDYESCVEWKSR